MVEEKFHLNYVEAELERQMKGANGGLVGNALEQARVRFAEFQEIRRRETAARIERLLDGGRRAS
jgi:hypothetical protein